MKTGMKLMIAVMSAVVLLSAAVALAEDFSAEMVSTTKDGVFQGKIFVTKDKVRMEAPDAVTISRMDKKVVWMLMPKDKMYMEQEIDTSRPMAPTEKVENEIERKLVGKEAIGGRMTEKYEITYNQNGNRETMYQWIASGLTIPVKIAAADNSWVIEYKNINTGSQPDSLFEVPAGYEKFSYQMPSMGNVMEGLGR
ncbi:MAG: DUF4412 domain-containing protein [Candidatus Omnitrophota bacterium]